MANVLRSVSSSLPVSSGLGIQPAKKKTKTSIHFFIRVGGELY